jgi:TrmH family RNA methyltransferase
MKHAAITLTSRSNPLLKEIRRISSESRRESRELVLAEGTRVLEEVHESGCPVRAVVVSESFGSDPRESNLWSVWLHRKTRVYRTTDKIFQSLSCVRTGQGALALVHVPVRPLPEDGFPGALLLYASGIQDPGNLGTLIRASSASGASLLCTSPGTCNARNPKAIRASAGVFFRFQPVENVSQEVFIQYCRRHSITMYRTDPAEGIAYTEADLRTPCAILLGNEANGLQDDVFTRFPSIRIPMFHQVESLNVAMAGAVFLFEAARQRSVIQRRQPGVQI